VVTITLVNAANFARGELPREVNRMKLFTSLAVIVGSLGDREEGQTMAQESLVMVLIILAVLGAISLFGRLA
jgi:hypothetical protein